ncbi:hypothetical protein PN462_22380 [Spirulina sp. CS-785/01]|uniref:hypothetical protein n=1 Tax=Spirulina sp. CS-785/01 TaxID=3021716 RepID=UPI00232C98BC|nr:hypothetical protein [Spirulina sp. CS-785/01]MDB9315876.1 hypothetical protein [Spirulina sp. CS-785/01]
MILNSDRAFLRISLRLMVYQHFRCLTFATLILLSAGVSTSCAFRVTVTPENPDQVSLQGNRVATQQSEFSSPETKVALAKHLTAQGVKMYGAYWCPQCDRQLQLFGNQAAQHLTEIECDPRGENAQTQLCRDQGISGYPTWEINGKLYPGVYSLEGLAMMSQFPGLGNSQ